MTRAVGFQFACSETDVPSYFVFILVSGCYFYRLVLFFEFFYYFVHLVIRSLCYAIRALIYLKRV